MQTVRTLGSDPLVSPVRMSRPSAISARWRDVAILSWPIGDDHLAPFLPNGLVLDRWDGEAYISLVCLFVENLRAMGLPVWPRKFVEINLRFYVRPTHSSDSQRGVVFLKQLAPHPLVALGARCLFREPMSVAPTGMWHGFAPVAPRNGDFPRRLHYRWRNHGRDEGLQLTSSGSAYRAQPGSLDDFLTARYRGYNGQSGGRVRSYRISRDSWWLLPVTDYELECDARSLYGVRFGDVMSGPPASALLATGSDARVHWPSTFTHQAKGPA